MKDLFPNRIHGNPSDLDLLDSSGHHRQTSNIYTHHTYPPAARLPRIVKIPLKNKFSFPIRLIRLEFDHTTANYYSEIDTVTLHGTILSNKFLFNENKSCIQSSSMVSYIDIYIRDLNNEPD